MDLLQLQIEIQFFLILFLPLIVIFKLKGFNKLIAFQFFLLIISLIGYSSIMEMGWISIILIPACFIIAKPSSYWAKKFYKEAKMNYSIEKYKNKEEIENDNPLGE